MIFLRDLKAEDPDLFQRALKTRPANHCYVQYAHVLPVLEEALLSAPSDETRLKVAKFLEQTMFRSRQSPPKALLQATKDPCPAVRRTALDTIRRSELQSMPEAIPWALQAMEAPDPQLRRAAIGAWRNMGLDLASEGVQALIKALDDKEKTVRLETISTLAWLGPEAEAAVPALLKIMQGEPEELLRHAATRALLAIDPAHRLILPYLEALQGDSTRGALLQLLRRIGQEARSLRQELQLSWGVGRGSNPPHPDGPELPGKFWLDGKLIELPPVPLKLLTYLSGKECVPIKDVEKAVWGTAARTENRLKSALKVVNQALLDANVQHTYGKKKEYIRRL
jgi:hypothetical protein